MIGMNDLGLHLQSTTKISNGFTAKQNKPRGYKTFSCSTQLSMKFKLLINIKIAKINENLM